VDKALSQTIRTVRESVVYQCPFGTVRDDEVTFRDGTPGTYLTVTPGDGNPGVVVIPWAQGRLGLVQVYRYPIGAPQWGFPRGFAHGPDPLVSAREELREELGLVADLSLIGWFTPDSGIQDSRVAVVLAQADHAASAPVDVNEILDTQWVAPAQLWALLGQPTHDDGMTMAALALAIAQDSIPALSREVARHRPEGV